MGLDSDCGETLCEDLDSGKLGEMIQEDSDMDMVLEVQIHEDPADDSGTSKTYACPYEDCDKAFSRPYRLAAHICFHTGKRPFKCDVPGCEKAYVRSSHLQRHVKMKHKPAPMYKQVFKCPHPGCLMELSDRYNLKRHYQRKHKQKCPFTCQYCDKGFIKHHQLQAHLYQHTGIPPFKCPTCGVGFTSQQNLKRHQRSHKTYICDCGKEFKNWSELRTHIMLSHPAEFICDICKKSFKAKCRLQKHMSVHQDLNKRDILPCPYENCPRFYYQNWSLTHHIKSSHEGKKYECTYPDCGRKLCTQQKLKNHMKLHDGKRPRPPKSCKLRKKRRDVGEVKRSMAALLSGMVVSHEEEKLLLTDSSCGVVVMENNNKQVTNCPDGDVAREALQNPEPQVKIMYDSSPCESENFVLSGKDSNEHNSGLKEAESRMDEQKKETYNGIASVKFQMDIREWIYLMKRIMEEIFPTAKSTCL